MPISSEELVVLLRGYAEGRYKVNPQMLAEAADEIERLGRVLINTDHWPNARSWGEPEMPGWRE